MNPPRDTDADGSPSNCCAFFISAVHDLSLHENHTPGSAAQQKFIILHLQRFHLPRPSVSFQPLSSLCATALYAPSFFPICTFASLCSCSESPLLILFPWLVLSLVQMSPWSAAAWLGDNRSDFESGGMAALLSLTQSYSDEPSTAKVRQREEK